jgi:isopenicillin N synthase-like dioxygenase
MNESNFHNSFPSISFSLVKSHDAAEVANLVTACETDGCFCLDLSDEDGLQTSMLESAGKLFDISKRLFEMPLEQKLRWEMDTWGDLLIGG